MTFYVLTASRWANMLTFLLIPTPLPPPTQLLPHAHKSREEGKKNTLPTLYWTRQQNSDTCTWISQIWKSASFYSLYQVSCLIFMNRLHKITVHLQFSVTFLAGACECVYLPSLVHVPCILSPIPISGYWCTQTLTRGLWSVFGPHQSTLSMV